MTRQIITVDIAPEVQYDRRLKVSQYDVGRPLGVYIVRNGEPVDCSGYTAQLYICKFDGALYERVCDINETENNLVMWETEEQESAAAGVSIAEIRIKQGDVNIGTANFTELVEESPSDMAVASHSESQSLIALVGQAEDAQEAAEEAQGKAETAQSKAEAAQRSAGQAAGDASQSASAAGSSELKAEGYAVGKQDGTDVESGSPYYQNNAKYYKEQAALSEGQAKEYRDSSQRIAQGIETAGAEQVQAINRAGTTQTQAVNQAGTNQVNAVEEKGQEVLDSIPEDYSDLSEEVADLNRALNDVSSAINFTDNMIGAKEIVFTEGAYIFTNYSVGSTVSLTPTTNASYAYAIVDCVAGDVFHITGAGAENAFLWTFIDSSNKKLSGSAANATGSNLIMKAPANASKIILNSTIAALGACIKGAIIKEDVAELTTRLDRIQSSRLVEQTDLAFSNSNFHVDEGRIYVTSSTSPYNYIAINQRRIDFKYRRRSSAYTFCIGVCIGGNFVGVDTKLTNTVVKTIYGTTNTTYENATINVSIADDTTGQDYNSYTATIIGQVFELKKGETTILKFTVVDGITIQGIAFLNYYLSYYSTTDNVDLKDCTIIIDAIEEEAGILEQKIDKRYQLPDGGIPATDLAEKYITEPPVIDFVTGYYIYTAGSVGTTVIDVETNKRANENYSYAYVDALQGDLFTINATGSGNAFLWVFLDSSGVMIARSTSYVGDNLLITAPENSAKLIINSTNAGLSYCYKGESIYRQIESVDLAGNDKPHRVIAGVIRNSGNGWQFIADENHQGDLNCVSVGVANDGRLFVDYSGINVKKVISAIFAPDETFASAGYIMGASVGKTASYIQIYQYGINSVSAKIVFENGDNGVEISVSQSDGVTSATWGTSDNTLNIIHDSISSKASGTIAPFVSVLPSTYGKYLIRLYSFSGTNTKFEFIDTATGNKVTSPNTGMSFTFNRIGTQLQRNEIDPATISSSNGNIWFMGIFEV